MYSGADKYGGAVVGVAGRSEGCSLQETLQTASAEETPVVPVPLPDGSQATVLLAAQLDVEDGGLAWAQVEDVQGTFNSAVSTSQMTSMLRDTDRNEAYGRALQQAVALFRRTHGRAPVVLDIGTGTGLLAMLAARAGAAKVYACEMFDQMAAIARHVTSASTAPESGVRNVFGEPMCNITVFPCKSSEVTVHEDGPSASAPHVMLEKADMVVSEILDSALLGEAVLPSLYDAFTRLLVPDAVSVPQCATIYAQVVDSNVLASMRRTHTAEARTGVPLARQDWDPVCLGGAKGLPLHFNQVQPPPSKLSEPFKVFDVDFSAGLAAEPLQRIVTNQVDVPITTDGNAHAVVFWWDLTLWQHGEAAPVQYTTRAGCDQGWQDHWVQVVFPLPEEPKVESGDSLSLLGCRTSTQVWFVCGKVYKTEATADGAASGAGAGAGAGASAGHDDASDAGAAVGVASAPKKARTTATSTISSDPEVCVCGLHAICNSQRLGMLNDASYVGAFRTAVDLAMENAVGSAGGCITVLDQGDGSLCALQAATFKAPAEVAVKVLCVEALPAPRVLSSALARGHASMTVVGSVNEAIAANDAAPFDVVLTEPFFFQMQSLVVWQCYNVWYKLGALRRAGAITDATQVVPRRARVMAVLVEFKHLARNHGLVGTVSGFDHSYLDSVQAGWHTHAYGYPVWMYEHVEVSDRVVVTEIDYASAPPLPPALDGSDAEVTYAARLNATRDASANAVVMWVDYGLTASKDGLSVSTGPTDGGVCHWTQSVLFLPEAVEVTARDEAGSKASGVELVGTLDTATGKMRLHTR